MTKTAEKTPPQARPTMGASNPDELRTAYEIHTLAQMMYGQLARTHPWMVQDPTWTARMHHAPGQTPFTAHPYAQWNQTWPVGWNPWTSWWGR